MKALFLIFSLLSPAWADEDPLISQYQKHNSLYSLCFAARGSILFAKGGEEAIGCKCGKTQINLNDEFCDPKTTTPKPYHPSHDSNAAGKYRVDTMQMARKIQAALNAERVHISSVSPSQNPLAILPSFPNGSLSFEVVRDNKLYKATCDLMITATAMRFQPLPYLVEDDSACVFADENGKPLNPSPFAEEQFMVQSTVFPIRPAYLFVVGQVLEDTAEKKTVKGGVSATKDAKQVAPQKNTAQ